MTRNVRFFKDPETGERRKEYYDLTPEQINAPPEPITPEQVDRERNRRVAVLTFSGKAYDFDASSQQNISAMGTFAKLFIAGGGDPAKADWVQDGTPFVWIAKDNSLNPMTAGTMSQFADAALAHKSGLIFAARALKDTNPIPQDYADDKHWP